MKVAAITITFNRLDLTKKTIESFYSKSNVDYHLIVDNGSDEETRRWIKQFDHIQLDKNYGIAYALAVGVNALSGYDYILKLDNDVETVTDQIIEKMLDFHNKAGKNFVCSPVDLLLDPNFEPVAMWKGNLNGFSVWHTSHTGGAFQLMPYDICKKLCDDYKHLAKGDYMIGHFYRMHGFKPTYLRDLEMKHIGLNQSTPSDKYIL